MSRWFRIGVPPLVIMVVALSLWAATGREAFTRWPDAKLEQADAETSDSELDLLADIGLDTEPAGETDIESRFAFGLLPSGADARHLPSVAMAAVLAVATVVVLRLRGRRTIMLAENSQESPL